jgi:hypothetical protein
LATADDARPTLRVIRGDATAEEIVALLAVLAARGDAGSGPAPQRKPTTTWADRAAAIRRPVPPGPGAWRASAWPR